MRLRNAAWTASLALRVAPLLLVTGCSLEELGAEFGRPTSTAGGTASSASGGAGGTGGGGWSFGGGGANHGLVIDPHNVAIHPSFEDGTDPWLQEAADGAALPLHIMLDDSPHGLWVAQAVEAKTSTDYFHVWDDRNSVPATVAGRRYTASVFVRAAVPASKGKPAFLYIREWSAGGDPLCRWTTPAQTLDDVEWSRFEISAVALNDGLELDVTFAQLESEEADSYYVDLFQVIADPDEDGPVPADCAEAGGEL